MSETTATPADKKLPKDIASEKGMVNVQIDGVWHQFPKGTRMIEACRSIKREIPHYCYHPKLSVPGNCRMCLVQMGMPPRLAPGQKPTYDKEGYQEIGWMPRPVISCANTVIENMGIRTTGQLVEKCREGVMEFLLINHPLDCPICDQAGECRLQEQSVGFGRGVSRFIDMKVKKPKNVDIGPRIRLDDERCIMCSRCIRFMDEVAKDPVLGFTQRGTHTTLTVHPGKLLDNNYSLNTADICPVGALTSNDFRFQMRVWFLKETPSIDVNCGTGTNIIIHTRENTIHRITPRQNDEVNSAWMPDSHRLNFHYIDSDQRLTEVLIKQANKHQTAKWSQALSQFAEAINAYKSSEIAIIASAKMTNEELFFVKKLSEKLGTELISTVARESESDGMLIAADRNPNTTGAQIIWDMPNTATKLSDIRNQICNGQIKALLVFGEELTAEAGFTTQDLEKLEFLVSSLLLAGATAQASDIVLPSASFAEKRGSMVNLSGRIQRLNRAIESPGDARDDWEIIRDMIDSISGETTSTHLIEDAFKAMAIEVSELNNLSLTKIGASGKIIKETGYQIPLLQDEVARKAAGTING